MEGDLAELTCFPFLGLGDFSAKAEYNTKFLLEGILILIRRDNPSYQVNAAGDGISTIYI